MVAKGKAAVRDGSERLQKQTKDIEAHGAWNGGNQTVVKFLPVRNLNSGKVSRRLAVYEWDSCNSAIRAGTWRTPWATRYNRESCIMHDMMDRARSIRGEAQLSLVKVK